MKQSDNFAVKIIETPCHATLVYRCLPQISAREERPKTPTEDRRPRVPSSSAFRTTTPPGYFHEVAWDNRWEGDRPDVRRQSFGRMNTQETKGRRKTPIQKFSTKKITKKNTSTVEQNISVFYVSKQWPPSAVEACCRAIPIPRCLAPSCRRRCRRCPPRPCGPPPPPPPRSPAPLSSTTRPCPRAHQDFFRSEDGCRVGGGVPRLFPRSLAYAGLFCAGFQKKPGLQSPARGWGADYAICIISPYNIA